MVNAPDEDELAIAQTIGGEGEADDFAPPAREEAFAERYERETLLGEGGMGVVWLHRDRRIGRAVAVKTMRRESVGRPSALGRFLREARVQGQLEHPSVVPVYDLGRLPNGDHYFTMKRVEGVALDVVLAELAAGTPGASEKYGLRRLLGALATACLAIERAHERGIIHRDLKPANLMLGDFGEVYVLDWGLAKPIGAKDDGAPDATSWDDAAESADTRHGAVIGTPGYMAPEQLHGDAVGPATDVYALGAILFEILAGEPLHRRINANAILASTISGAGGRASERAPGRAVPPELDALCEAATAVDSALRIPSARALHAGLERYLAGERDLILRRELAAVHATRASEACARVRSEGSIRDRRIAMQEIGRSLALDPESGATIELLVGLLNEPPNALPSEVVLELDRAASLRAVWIGRVGGSAYLSLLAFLPLFVWAGVRSWLAVGVFYACALTCAAFSFLASYRRAQATALVFAVMVMSDCVCASMSMFFGAFVIAPAAIAINTAGFGVYLDKRFRPWVLACGVLAVVAAVVADFGFGGATHFLPDGIVIRPFAIALSPAPMIAFLVAASLASVFLASIVVTRVRDMLGDAERRLYLYAWHLRELVPRAARAATDPTVEPAPARRS